MVAWLDAVLSLAVRPALLVGALALATMLLRATGYADPGRRYKAVRCRCRPPTPRTPCCVARRWNRACRICVPCRSSAATPRPKSVPIPALAPSACCRRTSSTWPAKKSTRRSPALLALPTAVGAKAPVGASEQPTGRSSSRRGSSAALATRRQQGQQTDDRHAGGHGRHHAQCSEAPVRRGAAPRPKQRQRTGHEAGQ